MKPHFFILLEIFSIGLLILAVTRFEIDSIIFSAILIYTNYMIYKFELKEENKK